MNRRGGQGSFDCSHSLALSLSHTLSLSVYLSVLLSLVVSVFLSFWLPFSFCTARIRSPFLLSFLLLPCPLPCESSLFLLSDRGRRTGGRKGRRRSNRAGDYTKANMIGGEKRKRECAEIDGKGGRERERDGENMKTNTRREEEAGKGQENERAERSRNCPFFSEHSSPILPLPFCCLLFFPYLSQSLSSFPSFSLLRHSKTKRGGHTA